MKKIFTLIAMALMAIGANADNIISYDGESSLTTGVAIGGTTAIASTKYKTNTTSITGIKIANGYTTDDAYNRNCIILSTANGFKAGDILTVKVMISHSDANKQGGVCVFTVDNENKTTMLDHSGLAINGKLVDDDLTEWQYALTADMDSINIGRYAEKNATATYVTYINVSRGGTTENSAPTISITEAVTATIGNQATISAVVNGRPNPEIKWYSNTTASNEGGTEIADQTNSTLTITHDKVGEYYYYAVATNSEGSATSGVCTVTVKDPYIYVSENDEIIFPETSYTAGSLNGCMFIGGALTLTVNDANNAKISTEDNNSYFGTEENYYQFAKRLKTGGKSDSKNSLKLTTTKAGKLNIYARSGNKDATDRTLVLKQNGSELFNRVIKDADAIQVKVGTRDDGSDNMQAVFPVYTVDVAVGDIDITYPVNTMVIYGFNLGDVLTGIETVNAPATQSPKAVKCTENGQLVVKKGNNRYNVAGALLK